jgi:spore maturation protein SpmB
MGSFELFYACSAFLKPRGEYILIAMGIPNSIGGFVAIFVNLVRAYLLPAFLGGVPRRFKLSLMNVTEEALQNLGRLIDQREIEPVLDSVWEFTAYDGSC